MDLSFCSGPTNLNQVLEEVAKVEKNVQISKEGYIGFLTIINKASRKLWVHPIKNKAPPVEYINQFLSQFGIQKQDPRKAIITTTEGGYLSKSRAFEDIAYNQNYAVIQSKENYIKELIPD